MERLHFFITLDSMKAIRIYSFSILTQLSIHLSFSEKMKTILIVLLVLVLPLMLMSQDTKKVLVIGIDGCRSDALIAATTPNIDALIASGVFSPDALNDDITISGPGWSAILCGVWSPKHLVTGNSFAVDDYETYPSFFQRAEEYNPELNTVSICHWSPINNIIVSDQADFTMNVSSDVLVASQASAYITENDPDLMFLHFDEADGVGHSVGFSPEAPQYISIIEEIDGLIGVVMEAIENRPTFDEEDWVFLLTTDHGGLGTNHGGRSIEEERVFVLASGKNVTPALVLSDTTVVNIEIENCLGDSIELQFDGFDDRVEVPAAPLLNFGADQDFTVECRVRTTNAGDVAIVGNKDWDTGLNRGFVFSFKFPSGPEWKVNIGDGSRRADINNGGEIADNEWHTLSVSFDRDGYMKMYQDGLIVDSTDISFIGNINTNEGLFFGTDINSRFDYEGSISEVRVWNSVVEKQSILDWHCSTLDDSHPDYEELIGYWKLSEGNGNVVQDFSLSNNSGTITDAVWAPAETTIVETDFSNTARLTDILPSALTHLCIPVEDDWNLDGVTLIPDCSSLPIDQDSDGYDELVDCDDTNPNVHPGQLEILYNGIDDDCDPVTLDDDLDQDGFLISDDCDDNNAAVNPSQIEIPYNQVDDDCNAATLDDDLDQDGFLISDDCDDNNAEINPGIIEVVYNGMDDDCDPATLDDDLDQDGFVVAQDCDDDNPDINPVASEVCDKTDNNCDGQIDEGLVLASYFLDADGDGFGDPTVFVTDCVQPVGYVIPSTDCDDNNPSISPIAVDIPDNGIDENCDGSDATDFVDNDGDGVTNETDCDDADPTVYPGGSEICDNKDNDCNGNVDDGLTFTTYFADLDNDGFGDPLTFVESCELSLTGFITNADDCDDNNPNVNPSQVEEPYNEVDEDCDPASLDDDLDQDGFLLADDCDDNDPNINPEAEEIPNNGIDENCDGMDLLSSTYALSNSTVDIFPNPTSELINIKVTGQLKFKANLYNLEGKLIDTTYNTKRIDIRTIPDGTYLIEIQDLDSDQRVVEKVVVRK